MIDYEFPINERIRTLLRLEDLYSRTLFFAKQDHPLDHHAALLGIFEIMEIASRADLKSDLLQELERQKQILGNLRNNPNISEEALTNALAEIETTQTTLWAMTGKFAQHLRENEWLMSIKQRTSIPGGVCEFDLPSYHYWRELPSDCRRADIERWFLPLRPIQQAAIIVLRMLRNSAKSHNYIAKNGSFQQMSSGKTAQLLRVSLGKDLPAIPELSANRYAINIRFVTLSTCGDRPKVLEEDIPFTLGYHNL